MNTSIIPMTKFLNIPVTLDRMLHLICYHWEICSEVEEIITKLVFWGDWRPSLVECPRLNFANECVTKKYYWNSINKPYNRCYPYDRCYPNPIDKTVDRILEDHKTLTKQEMLEVKKI